MSKLLGFRWTGRASAAGDHGQRAGAEAYSSVRIDGVPHVEQEPDFCGEACAEMALRKLGLKFDQNFVFNQSGLDPALGRGCYTGELVRALKTIDIAWQR